MLKHKSKPTMTIPCEELKCLMIPVCRSKEKIDCPHILKYYRCLTETYDWNDAWEMLKSYLHGMRSIKTGPFSKGEIYLEEVIKGKYGDAEYDRIFGD